MGADAAAVPLLIAGNLVAIVVIVRWVPVVREQRTRWFLAHAAAMTAIIASWAIRRPIAMAPNVVWLVASTVWYRFGARRPPGDPAPAP